MNTYERGNDQKNEYQDLVVSFTSVLSSRTVNEARVLYGTLYTFWNVDRYADPFGVSISRPSINLGKANNMPEGWDSVRYRFVNTLSHTIGRHDFKASVLGDFRLPCLRAANVTVVHIRVGSPASDALLIGVAAPCIMSPIRTHELPRGQEQQPYLRCAGTASD